MPWAARDTLAILRLLWVKQSFEAVATGHSRVVFTESDYDETWRDLIRHADGKIAFAIPELLSELRSLADEPPQAETTEYPFVLAAGERRAYNANQVYGIRTGASRAGTAHCASTPPMRLVSGLAPAIRHCAGRAEALYRSKFWRMKRCHVV